MFPGAEQPSIDVLVTIAENGFYKNKLTLDEHTGTHMDAPAHFDEGGTTADMLPVENFVAPLVVIDVSSRAASDPDTQGMPDDILAWESQFGPLPDGAFVALNSGWDARFSDPDSFINLDTDNVQHYPGWHPDAAALLVNERNIVGIGVDTLSLDFGASTDFGTHLTVLPAGKFGIENLANLATAPVNGGWIIVGGPKHETASGGPTRAFAVQQ
jgi:kynurenine formamidase